MRFDRARIETALAPLIGLPLWQSNRAGGMQTFQLGARHTEITERGPHKGQPITRGGPDPYAEPPDWNWDEPGANRRDERIQEWLRDRTYIVESVAADTLGGLTLTLSDGFSLSLFPDDSLDAEYWRLLRPGKDDAHFVVTGAGIED